MNVHTTGGLNRVGGIVEHIPSFRDRLHTDISYLIHTTNDEELKNKKFGLPKVKKFPMPDAAHVKSAIKFFNYATPSQEQELADAILARMNEYGMDPDSLNVGDENRFKKYLKKNFSLTHSKTEDENHYMDSGRKFVNKVLDIFVNDIID